MSDYRCVRYEDPAYPEKLRQKERMPGSLYIKGCFPDPLKYSVAIVGARQCSAYGRKAARDMAEELAKEGVQIISGLALGIDSYAHKGALDGGGKTFAVMGCGIDSCYPLSNTRLYEDILKTGGGIISEFVPGALALPYHFPIRNRIISGLSDAVIVVEAKKRSGSLITANYALEQGVPVFAVPGRLNDPLSEGPNDLLFQGAAPALSAGHIMDELGIKPLNNEAYPVRKQDKGLSEKEKRIYEELSSDPVTLEYACQKTGFDIVSVSEALIMLELKGYAAQLSPGHYVIT